MAVKNSMIDNIQEYKFTTLDASKIEAKDNVRDYEIKTLDSYMPASHEKILIERKFAKENKFNISPIVKNHRGILLQEEEDRQKEIATKVEEKFRLVKEEAFKKGYEDGFKSGTDEALLKMRESSSDKIDKLTEIITTLMKEKEQLLEREKREVYYLIKSLTKWIILRELEDDDDYVKRLLEKMIMEIGKSQSLLVQMSQKQFENIPEIQKFIQENIGGMKNVRVEIDHDIHDKGIVIESKNFIIKGTVEEQLRSFDKVFENVGLSYDKSRTDS